MKMANRYLSVVLLFFLVLGSKCQDSPKVHVREANGYEEEVQTHEILVECPDGCMERVFFELDCFTGDLVTGRPANDYIDLLEQKLDALEELLTASGLGVGELAQDDINTRVSNLEEKVDQVVKYLSS